MHRRVIRLLFTLAAFSVVVACGNVPGPGEVPWELPAEALAPPDAAYAAAADHVEQLARDLVVEEGLPGVSIAVAVDGRVAWAGAVGWSDLEARVPLTPYMRFRVGGISQSLTAAAAGRLLERGVLDLDVPVRDYLPSLPAEHGRMTMRQLMGHTAGLGHYGGGESSEVNVDDELAFARTTCTSATDALDFFVDAPLRFEPGTAVRYSSYGWVLASAVIEAIAGQPFPEVVDQEVFTPVGMPDTMLDGPAGPLGGHGEPVPGGALLYYPAFAMRTRHGLHAAPNVNYTCLMGADGFISTPTDLVRFGTALSQGVLLEPATVEMLQSESRLPLDEPTGYGLGWFVRNMPLNDTEARVVGHGGMAVGGSTSFLTLPDHRLVVAVSSNVSFAGDAVRSLALSAAEAFVGR